jgi:hypothetical protein
MCWIRPFCRPGHYFIKDQSSISVYCGRLYMYAKPTLI